MEQFIANGLCRGATYAVVALGFGLIYTTSRVFHIAHGAVYVAAGYVLYWSLAVLGHPMPAAIGLALLVSAILGIAVEILVYRPLERRHASAAALMISSLGAYTVGINIVAMLAGNESRVIRAGVESTVTVAGAVLTRVQVAQFAVSLAAIALYGLFLRVTPLGRVCRALADDTVLASVLGVRVEATRLVVFALGSVLAGTGAVLVSLDIGVDGRLGFPVVMTVAVACIVGGLHRFMAPALGGLLLGVAQSLVVWLASAAWESAATFAILIGCLLLRPEGLLGMRRRLEEQ